MTAPIKVISLASSTDRKKQFADANPTLHYEFVPAVDGRLLSEAQLHDERLFRQPLPLWNKGAYGCALSHLARWEEAIANDCPITVAEDDTIFRADFAAASAQVIAQLPAQWDIIVWGWNFDSILSIDAMPGVSPIVMLFDQASLRKNADGFKRQSDPSHPFRLDKCLGTPAYTISPAGAAKFKAACFPVSSFELFFLGINNTVINSGIDITMNRVYGALASYVSFPPLVITHNDASTSTIGAR